MVSLAKQIFDKLDEILDVSDEEIFEDIHILRHYGCAGDSFRIYTSSGNCIEVQEEYAEDDHNVVNYAYLDDLFDGFKPCPEADFLKWIEQLPPQSVLIGEHTS